jgi:dsDNA-specific endonuclease/ATPase MutS2
MKLETITLEKPVSMVVLPLPKEVQEKLAKYCPLPTQNNLATQYYFWNLELQKEIKKLQKENQKLIKKENKNLRKIIEDLKKKVEDLLIEKQNFLKMLFKPKRPKKRISVTKETIKKPRTEQSYYPALS